MPDPTRTNTILRYYVPENIGIANLAIVDAKGRVVKQVSLNNRGVGQLNLNISSLAAGEYTYTLSVDNQQVDSKTLVVSR